MATGQKKPSSSSYSSYMNVRASCVRIGDPDAGPESTEDDADYHAEQEDPYTTYESMRRLGAPGQ